jgi:hypothetical protein
VRESHAGRFEDVKTKNIESRPEYLNKEGADEKTRHYNFY